MVDNDQTYQLAREDGHLVNLVQAALTDPNLHTDLRMRLAQEISELLQPRQVTVERPSRYEPPRQSPDPDGDGLSRELMSVLVDPNLHTDLRMRLYREIPELVRSAHEQAAERAKQAR